MISSFCPGHRDPRDHPHQGRDRRLHARGRQGNINIDFVILNTVIEDGDGTLDIDEFVKMLLQYGWDEREEVFATNKYYSGVCKAIPVSLLNKNDDLCWCSSDI